MHTQIDLRTEVLTSSKASTPKANKPTFRPSTELEPELAERNPRWRRRRLRSKPKLSEQRGGSLFGGGGFKPAHGPDLELQARHHPGLRERELFYWARMYTTQIGRGDNYLELKPTICIFILNFSDSDSPIFHSIFRVLEIHDHREFSRDLEIHTLELPKLEEEAAHDPESPVLKWRRFFRATTDEELEKLAMADPDMNAAKQALDRPSADPKAQQLAEDRELAIWNYKRTVQLAEQQGKAEALRDVLAKLLTLKFGKISEEVHDRIQSAHETEVLRWTEGVLSAPSVDSIFQG